MSYDDTSTHRHGSPNGYLLPINRAVSPVNNNYRDGSMQPLIFQGSSASSPNNIGGVLNANASEALAYTGLPAEGVSGAIGRYPILNDNFGQARTFWRGLDKYAQQHTVDAYRFEVGHTSPPIQAEFIKVLNKIDNCLARRVAFGIGAELPAVGSGPAPDSSSAAMRFPSLYPLAAGMEPNKSNEGLVIGVLADDGILSPADLGGVVPLLSAQRVLYEVVAPRMGRLQSGVMANQSFITTSSIFYDAIIVGSIARSGPPPPCSAMTAQLDFLAEAYSHGKAIGAISSGSALLDCLRYRTDEITGIFSGGARDVTTNLLTALSGPVRFPNRFPVDNPSICQ